MTTAPPRPRARPGGTRSGGALSRRPASSRRRPGRGGGRRLAIGRLVLVVALAVATLKLVVVQTVQAPSLSAASARQAQTPIMLPAARGPILDRNGRALAFSVEASALVTNPRQIRSVHPKDAGPYTAAIGAAVAQATGAAPDSVAALLDSDKGYVVLAPNVDPDVAKGLRVRFPEIAIERREDRQYPAGDVAANVLGAAGWDATAGRLAGRVGLESSQDNLLAGFDGLRIVDTADRSNTVIPGSTRSSDRRCRAPRCS